MLPPKILYSFLILFAISLAFRYPTLNRPLSVHHENNTAQSLVTFKGWEKKGLSASSFLPIVTFQNPADKNIPNFGGVKDKEGNYYYVSYPPFGFLLPYFILKTLHLDLNVLNLQLWNLFLHGVGALLVLLLLFTFSPFKEESTKKYSALLGAALYLFAPGALWFHANVYFLENSLLPLWLLTLYVFFCVVYRKFKSRYALVLLFVCNFFASYTEWTMVFFNGVAIFYLLFNKNYKNRFPVIGVLAASSGLALSIFLFQAIHLNGWDAFTSFIFRKFRQRSGFSPNNASEARSLKGYLTIAWYYTLGFAPVLLSLLISFCLTTKKEIKRVATERPWFLFTILPIAAFHFIFFNFSRGHEYSSLKGVIPLSLLGGLWFGSFLNGMGQKKRRPLFLIQTFGIMGLGGLVFFFTNIAPEKAPIAYLRSLGTPSKKPLELGQAISLLANGDEMVFVSGDCANPPVVLYYAQRNIQYLKPGESVQTYLNGTPTQKAVIFNLGLDWKVKNIQRVVASRSQ